MPVDTELPDMEEHGRTGEWKFTDQEGETHAVSGMFLGLGSSYRDTHKGHPSTDWAPRGTHCSTCRWTEIRLFRSHSGAYCLVKCGASDVPGERDLIKVIRISTPFEVIENLTTTDRISRNPTLTFPARHALAQSASHDSSLRDAYINSPVTRS